MSTRTEQISHPVTTTGPAAGLTFSGLLRRPDELRPDAPLIVAVHGGGYTSTYFDVPGHSLFDRAAQAGIPIVAIDRPGYGATALVEAGESIILSNAAVLDQVVGELWDEYGTGTSGVVLVGHSIGGAVVTAVAARNPSWPLLGIAVSGCLLQVPPESRDAWDALPDTTLVEVPAPVRDVVMFGPEWTYREPMPAASHVADALVPKAELLDITGGWIERVASVAGQVRVPVHSRQGRFDRLWINDEQQVADFAAAFASAPTVDARLVPSGHCIDFHRYSAAFQLDQLAFALACGIREE
jgi:pimeloyl-ACP methyl ester carboxylesterase